MKTVVSWLVIVLVCAMGYTQVFGQVKSGYTPQIERIHSGVDETSVSADGTAQLIKSAQASQEVAAEQLRQLVQQYPEEATVLETVERLHENIAVLLRNEENRNDDFLYQQALYWLEDLAFAVNSINNETAKQNCLNTIDHIYYFAPGMELSSLREITDYIQGKLLLLTNGWLTIQWGDFYKNLDGYSN